MSSRNKICTCGSGKLYRKCCGKSADKASHPAGSSLVSLPDGQQLPLEQVMQGAITLHQAGRVRKAAELYKCVLAVKPRHADALHLLGLTERHLGNLPQAAELIRSAIAINPRVALFHSNLGQVYCAQGKAVEAEASARRAIELDPLLPEAHLNLGHALRLRHLNTEAMTSVEQALRLRPDYSDALLARGDLLHEAKQYEQALACYQQILVQQPANPAALTRVGINLRVQGRLQEAIDHYESAIQRFPKIPELHHNLAMVYHRAGRLDNAIASLRCLLEITPADATAQHLLAVYEGKTTDRAPAEHVRELFDSYAETFESHLVQKLGYHTPDLLADAIRNHAAAGKKMVALDLGCGTGLMGVLLRDQCESLTGIDISPKMLDKAREKGLYSELLAVDILPYMQSCTAGSLDLVVAADVFVYLGDLAAIFAETHRVLRSGGLFAFSVEAAPGDVTAFDLDSTGRYRHAADYLHALAVANGLDNVHFASSIIRYQHDVPVTGYLCVLRKA